MKTLCAVCINDLGQILSYTCQPTMEQCEEFCSDFFPGWNKMKELGSKVVSAHIEIDQEDMEA